MLNLILIVFFPFVLQAKTVFYFQDGNIYKREPLNNISELIPNNDAVEFTDDLGNLHFSKIDLDKLCKKSGGFEPWSYHSNPDGSLGLIGMNVEIPVTSEGTISILDSSVCGHVKLEGSITISNSQLYGGPDDLRLLSIDGKTDVKTSQISIINVTSELGAWGEIAGKLYMFGGSVEGEVSIQGDVWLSNATISNGVTIFGYTTPVCEGLCIGIDISESNITGPNTILNGWIYIYNSPLMEVQITPSNSRSSFISGSSLYDVTVTGSLSIDNMDMFATDFIGHWVCNPPQGGCYQPTLLNEYPIHRGLRF